MAMFKPVIKLILNPNLGTYTMEANVIVPNGCYSAAGATLGVPDGTVIVPEAQGVVLNIIKHDGPCTEAIKVLTFKLECIPLSAGKSSLVAFAVVGEDVAGVSSGPIPKPDDTKARATGATPPSGIVINSLNGWINAMPPGPPNLIALVNVWAPCMNFKYDFRVIGPFGFTGRTLLVEMTATLPGACAKAIYEGPVRFEHQLESANLFDSLAIEFEGRLYMDQLEIVV